MKTHLLLAAMTLFPMLTPLLHADPVRVVCIGDSITQGRGDKSASGAPQVATYGWRYDFWKKCIDAGDPIEMVGGLTTGFETTPVYADYQGQKFNNHHESLWGRTTEDLRDELTKTSSRWTADLAIIYLGSNEEKLTAAEKTTDPYGVARTDTAMRAIITILRANNPHMAMILRNPYPYDPRSIGLQTAYRKIASELGTPDSPIVTVDQGPDWQWDPHQPNSDTVDGAHPTQQGDEKLASDFFKAAEPFLKR